MRAKLLCDLETEGLNRPFRGRIVCTCKQAPKPPRLRAHIDHAAIGHLHHMWQNCPGCAHTGCDVHIHHPFPILFALLKKAERRVQRPSNIVNQNVNLPGLTHLGHGSLDVLR